MRSDSAQFLSARACLRRAIKSSISSLERPSETAPPCRNSVGSALQQADDTAQGFQAAGEVYIIGFVHFACQLKQHGNRFDRTKIVVHGGVEAAGVVIGVFGQFERGGRGVFQGGVQACQCAFCVV